MPNNPCLYLVPQQYCELGLGQALTTALELKHSAGVLPKHDLLSIIKDLPATEHIIGIVTKYTNEDAHQSLKEALFHAGVECRRVPKVCLIDAEELERSEPEAWRVLRACHGIVVAGGFGERGIAGKLSAIKHARENGVPYLGICLGMQLCIIELLRAGGIDVDSTEFNRDTLHPVVCLVDRWVENNQIKIGVASQSGGTMRLGAHQCIAVRADTVFARAYGGSVHPTPRHRHRYEVNPEYEQRIQDAGMVVTARSEDGLIEGVELSEHPWFVGVQYHPEFTSLLGAPEPIVLSFVRTVLC